MIRVYLGEEFREFLLESLRSRAQCDRRSPALIVHAKPFVTIMLALTRRPSH
jgi:hypothetical protein